MAIDFSGTLALHMQPMLINEFGIPSSENCPELQWRVAKRGEDVSGR